MIDVLMYKNNTEKFNCKIYALGHSEQRMNESFGYCCYEDTFHFIKYDVNKPLICENIQKGNYIFHMASNTHPMQYSTDPIGTITTNIIGT